MQSTRIKGKTKFYIFPNLYHNTLCKANFSQPNRFSLFDLRSPTPENKGVSEISHNSKPVSGRSSSVHARLRLVKNASIKTVLALCLFGLTATTLADDHIKSTQLSNTSALATGTKLRHWLQTGQASWYGLKFQGHKTATGEHFDMHSLTCAHRSLPLGSWIRVTNLRNRKSIFVRVNDRGPIANNRIVDLSFAAAHAVGLDGIGKVKLEAVSPNDPEMTRALVAQLQVPAIPLVSR